MSKLHDNAVARRARGVCALRALVENTSFSSSGDICCPPLLSLVFDKISMDKTDSDGFFSR